MFGTSFLEGKSRNPIRQDAPLRLKLLLSIQPALHYILFADTLLNLTFCVFNVYVMSVDYPSSSTAIIDCSLAMILFTYSVCSWFFYSPRNSFVLMTILSTIPTIGILVYFPDIPVFLIAPPWSLLYLSCFFFNKFL